MPRKLVVDNCNVCPFKVTKEGYLAVANGIPMCSKEAKVLPYVEEKHAKQNMAIPTGLIPDWCGLAFDGVEDFSDLV